MPLDIRSYFGKCSAVFEILSLLDSAVNVVGGWILWILLFRHFTVDFVTMTGFRFLFFMQTVRCYHQWHWKPTQFEGSGFAR